LISTPEAIAYIEVRELSMSVASNAAAARPQGEQCAADRREFAPDPTQFQMLLFDDKVV